MKVEIWSDVVCPWCFIGERRLATALAGFDHAADVEITYRSFELHPEAHGDGKTCVPEAFARMMGTTEARAHEMFANVTRIAAGVGLHYDLEHAIAANTFDAHRLIHLAADRGRQDAVVQALFETHLCDARDIQSHDVLTAVGTGAGLDAAEVRDVLASDRYADDVHHDEDRARALGITGVPFFVLEGKYGISGAQEPAVLRRALDQVWAESHPAPSPLQPVPAAGGSTSGGAEGEPGPGSCGPDGCAI